MLDKCYIIPVQNACNCDCIFCISKSRNYDKKDELLKVDNKFIENIQLLKRRNIKKFEITGGGEPLIHPDIELIVSIIKRIIPDSYIKLYTNGFILKTIEGIDEVNLSIISDNDEINALFMDPKNNIPFNQRIMYFRENYPSSKLRLSIPLIKGGVDNIEKLDALIKNTTQIVDEYVVRTLYPHSLIYSDSYVEFPINNKKVIYEKDNDVSDFDGLILWSDNEFYKDFNLDKKRYLYGYLLLKPDSATYINEIEEIIFIITNMSFHKQIKNDNLNFQIVQDADKLDALGSIGIIRTIQYGTTKSRLFYEEENLKNINGKLFFNKSTETTLSHFYDKLLKLPMLMNTKTGKSIAVKRVLIMNDFLDNFYQELEN